MLVNIWEYLHEPQMRTFPYYLKPLLLIKELQIENGLTQNLYL
jgi:hypothetical protein